MSDVTVISAVTTLLMPAQIKPKLLNQDGTFFFYSGWMRLQFTWVLGR